jgi:hypothetical protein
VRWREQQDELSDYDDKYDGRPQQWWWWRRRDDDQTQHHVDDPAVDDHPDWSWRVNGRSN